MVVVCQKAQQVNRLRTCYEQLLHKKIREYLFLRTNTFFFKEKGLVVTH
ncbi:MAG: hypothetical protein ACJA2B_000364 [Candidatus Endobugula sp.]|jgi:hypothetical protein